MRGFSLCAALLAALALPTPGAAAPPADLQYFAGTWQCGAERWTFTPFGTGWMRIAYGHGDTVDGIAYAGYVAQLGAYVYRDFHADGSYADLQAAPPTAAGVWTWRGPYYPAGQAGTLTGEITYSETGTAAFTRTFASRERDGSLVPHGGDSCTKGDT
jgi:hypothetical protein